MLSKSDGRVALSQENWIPVIDFPEQVRSREEMKLEDVIRLVFASTQPKSAQR